MDGQFMENDGWNEIEKRMDKKDVTLMCGNWKLMEHVWKLAGELETCWKMDREGK